LEKTGRNFPSIIGNFSTSFFQTLEKLIAIFPTLGKSAAPDAPPPWASVTQVTRFGVDLRAGIGDFLAVLRKKVT